MAKSALRKLEDYNIRSLELDAGDSVISYLEGGLTRTELRGILTDRRKELMQSIKGIDKLLTILPDCPREVKRVD
jgi:hypothetical protein